MSALQFALPGLPRLRHGRPPQPRYPSLVIPPAPSPTLWRQPPVYSPLRLRDVLGAMRQAYVERIDPLPGVRALLRQNFRADTVDLLDSGTQALQLALRAAGRMAGGGRQLTGALPAYGGFALA